jgi:outer membrane biosynthesis protein TonB
MENRTFRKDELAGLAIAALLHVLLAIALLFQPEPDEEEKIKPQERIAVSLASEVGLTATSPDPAEVSRAAQAPVISPDNTPGVEAPDVPEITPDPAPPEPDAAPAPSNTTPRDTSPRRRPDKEAKKTPPKKSPPKKSSAKKSPPKKSPPKKTPPKKSPPKKAPPKKGTGGSAFGEAFKDGAGTSSTGSSKSAAPFGRAERSALNRAITRALRPHWRGKAPTGLDADKLVTPVTWRLNRDGSLKGAPRCKSAKGVTPSNRPQIKRHCDAALRAVRLAAPFKLPEQFYTHWDNLEWEFDRKL